MIKFTHQLEWVRLAHKENTMAFKITKQDYDVPDVAASINEMPREPEQ